MANEKARTYAQLTADGVVALNRFKEMIPLKKDWFFMMRRDYGTSARETNWPLMRRGEPVPFAMLKAFAKYMGKKSDWQLDLHEFIVPAVSPMRNEDDPAIHAWSAGLRTTMAWVKARFIETENSHCLSLKELRDSSEHIIRDVGRSALRQTDKTTSELELAIGEQLMNLKVDEFDAWRRKWWERDPRVLLATEAGDTVVIPLTDDAAERFRTSRANDTDLDPATDYCFPSRNLMINCVANRPSGTLISRNKVAWVQLRCVLTQLATFVSPEALQDEDVRILSFGGTPDNKKWLTVQRRYFCIP